MEDLISIIVPVYKVEKYIRQCVDSILNQTYRNIDLVLVDDGSPDSCPEICDYYAEKDNRVHVVHKKNGGLTSAWMAGVENIQKKSNYVSFVDSDDWIDNTYIEDLVAKAKEYDADVVIGNTVKFFGEKKYTVPLRHDGLYDEEKLSNELFPNLLFDGRFHGRSYPVSRWGKLYKKSILQNNIKYCNMGTSYAEDLNLTFPIMLDAKRVYFLTAEEGVYFYRLNPDSMLHAYDKTMLSSILYVFPTLLKVCDEKGQEQMKPQVVADCLAASVQYYKNELQNPLGLKITKQNIELYCKNELLIYAINTVDWRKFRMLNVIIIRSMKNYCWFNKHIITVFLRILKTSGIRRPT